MGKSKASQKIANVLKSLDMELVRSSNSFVRSIGIGYAEWSLFRMQASGLIGSYSITDAEKYYDITGSREFLDNDIILGVFWSESKQPMKKYRLLLTKNGEVIEEIPPSENRKVENENIKGTLF